MAKILQAVFIFVVSQGIELGECIWSMEDGTLGIEPGKGILSMQHRTLAIEPRNIDLFLSGFSPSKVRHERETEKKKKKREDILFLHCSTDAHPTLQVDDVILNASA